MILQYRRIRTCFWRNQKERERTEGLAASSWFLAQHNEWTPIEAWFGTTHSLWFEAGSLQWAPQDWVYDGTFKILIIILKILKYE
jgi:hypothetical protein